MWNFWIICALIKRSNTLFLAMNLSLLFTTPILPKQPSPFKTYHPCLEVMALPIVHARGSR